MKYNIDITSLKLVDEIENYWTESDYVTLLGRFNFPDAKEIKKEELREMLFMAITDFEPAEANAILLSYKLSEYLNEGQIDQLSHEMLTDKVSEEYPEISLHSQLFSINQLLYKAYNGKFPSVKASVVDFTMQAAEEDGQEITKEMVLKVFGKGLSDRCLIKRLFTSQMDGEGAFPEATDILWFLKPLGGNNYQVITSEYWLNRDDFIAHTFEGIFIESTSESGND